MSRTALAFRSFAILTVLAFVALLVYGLFKQAPTTTIDDALAQQQAVPAPGFELAVLADGDPPSSVEGAWETAAADGRVDLTELRGVPVVLNFWASWCDPCQEEAPVLARSGRRWGDQGVLSSASTCRTSAKTPANSSASSSLTSRKSATPPTQPRAGGA